MPIYEYSCKACNKKFEKLIKSMSQETRIECPACGSKKTERELSVFAVGAEGSKSSAGGHSHGAGCGCCGAAGTQACPRG